MGIREMSRRKAHKSPKRKQGTNAMGSIQWNCLRLLASNDQALCVKEVTKALDDVDGIIRQALNTLVERGLVTKYIDDRYGGYRYAYTITPAGKQGVEA